MTVTVELQRVGMSRIALTAIPIMARAVHGQNLLAGRSISDVEEAKAAVTEILTTRLMTARPEIHWINRT